MDRAAVRTLLIRLLREQPDLTPLRDAESWSLIRQNASAYGVAQLIAFVSRRHVTGEDKQWCDQALIRSWKQFDTTLRHLEDVVAVLDDAGVPVIPLKGPFLAWRMYNPPFLRQPSVDLDLAVRDKDLERACAALERAEYTLSAPIEDARACAHEVGLIHESKPRLELHFRLSHAAYGIPIEEFFDRAAEAALPSGRRVLVLDPVDELLHLTLHFASERFRSLFHLYELRRQWSAATPSAREAVIKRAVEHGFAGTIALTDIGFRLYWNERFVPAGVTLPKTWLHWRVNEQLYKSLENWNRGGVNLTTTLRGRWLDLQTTDRVAGALRLLPILVRVARTRLRRHQLGALPSKYRLGRRKD